jgi:hypothetical protein
MAERSATRAATQQSQLSQNQYLLLFSGEAHNVEVGITNELFQIEREEPARRAPRARREVAATRRVASRGLARSPRSRPGRRG